MKKKLLFVLPSFGIGGTTVSTRNLISLLDVEKYDVSVLSLRGDGNLKEMYDGVPQLKTDFVAHSLALVGWRDHKRSISRLAVMVLRFIANHNEKLESTLIKYSAKRVLKNQKFDTIIACQEGIATKYVSQIKADNKVAWVRCDYQRYMEECGISQDNTYLKYNIIVCVAQKLCDGFKQIYPAIADKVLCINNPQNEKLIIDGAGRNDYDPRFVKDTFTIVSVGRFSPVKRLSLIPGIARQLLDEGMRFKWYIVGDGEPERTALERNIKDLNVSDAVVLLGYKSNPHFYISEADLLVCLSYSEACPRIIDESKILGTPIVSTDFPTIHEFIENGKNGIICPINSVSQAIKLMITDKGVYAKYKKAIYGYTFDNSKLIDKIEAIL